MSIVWHLTGSSFSSGLSMSSSKIQCTSLLHSSPQLMTSRSSRASRTVSDIQSSLHFQTSSVELSSISPKIPRSPIPGRPRFFSPEFLVVSKFTMAAPVPAIGNKGRFLGTVRRQKQDSGLQFDWLPRQLGQPCDDSQGASPPHASSRSLCYEILAI